MKIKRYLVLIEKSDNTKEIFIFNLLWIFFLLNENHLFNSRLSLYLTVLQNFVFHQQSIYILTFFKKIIIFHFYLITKWLADITQTLQIQDKLPHHSFLLSFCFVIFDTRAFNTKYKEIEYYTKISFFFLKNWNQNTMKSYKLLLHEREKTKLEPKNHLDFTPCYKETAGPIVQKCSSLPNFIGCF